MLRRQQSLRLIVVTLLAPVALLTASATAAIEPIAIVPSVYTGSTYAVRPATIVLESAAGGELIIHWQTWSATAATGSGTSNPDHGVYPINVRLSEPKYGTFQAMSITTLAAGKTYHGQFKLSLAGPTSTIVLWSNASELRSSGAVNYDPPGDGSCPRDREQSISGAHGITLIDACQIAADAANSNTPVLCVPGAGGHVLVYNRKKTTYDGYAVTPTSGLYVFQRGPVYFSLATVCN